MTSLAVSSSLPPTSHLVVGLQNNIIDLEKLLVVKEKSGGNIISDVTYGIKLYYRTGKVTIDYGADLRKRNTDLNALKNAALENHVVLSQGIANIFHLIVASKESEQPLLSTIYKIELVYPWKKISLSYDNDWEKRDRDFEKLRGAMMNKQLPSKL